MASLAGCTDLLGGDGGSASGGGATTDAGYTVVSGVERIERVFQGHIDRACTTARSSPSA